MWKIVLAAGLAAAAVAAAAASPPVHMGVTALAGLVLAAAAIAEGRRLAAEGVPESRSSAAVAQNMAAVWLWGAASLLPTYLWFAAWPEWWKFVLVLAALGLLCLGFAALMARDWRAGREDPAMLTLGRRLTAAQLAGTIVAMAGLILDGKMTRFLNIRKGWEDWAASNIFFSGALALALISFHALWTGRRAKADAAAAE